MKEIQVALIAIALVLSAVFLPMAFFGGSTGVIYRQFSVTIVSAMVLSVLVALILSPALTATLLKRKEEQPPEQTWLGRRFPKTGHGLTRRATGSTHFERMVDSYANAVDQGRRSQMDVPAIYAIVAGLMVLLFIRLPTGFLPTEDQGTGSIQMRLPAGATIGRTLQVQQQVEEYFLDEKKNVRCVHDVAGGGGGGGPSRTPARAS
jgi:multidrug efflux pump